MEPDPTVTDPDEADADTLITDLAELESELDATARDELEETQGLVAAASKRGLIDSGVRRFQFVDVVEAFVGSVIVASPLLVEDGVFDIADYLFQFTLGGIPVFLVANTLFVVLMTYALVEWTGRAREEAEPFFNVVPVRVVVILAVSFLVATILMTVWGRVGDWQPPTEALARINIIWTVGSLGAALGDIISEGHDAPPLTSDDESGHGVSERITGVLASADDLSDEELLQSLNEQFDELVAAVEKPADRRAIERIRDRTVSTALDTGLGDQIRKYTGRDVAEAFVGSIFFSVPFLVEDGVFDVAAYFLSFRLGEFPVFYLANAAFVVVMIAMLVYWAGPQDVRPTQPLFGFVPPRLVGIALVSFLTAAALMTMWGRVDDWANPSVALARISVVWTVASFGAALGDILPGESSGGDLSDELDVLDRLVRED
ncbi:hypothetical protein [Halarchaeum sp. P4]|uniref:hypothetical protein n=1 Tax=Halarchaeum sp. P4 TaxID=3421639 RepID=UPI003EBF1E13